MNLADLTQYSTIAIPIITLGGAVITAVILWTKIGDKLDNQRADNVVFDKRLSILETKVENMQPIWEEIRGRLIAIETSIAIHFKKRR